MNCIKRQRERANGQEVHRCLNPESEHHTELVVIDQCNACPVKRLRQEATTQKPDKCTSCREIKLEIVDDGFVACPFRLVVDGQPKCTVTGLPVDKEICQRCDADAREATATLTDKVFNYSMAVRKWVAAGRPTRTDEEVQQIFEDHCSKCDRYDSVKKACKACGCSVTLGSNPLTNKIKMKTEGCPLGRFK